MKLRYSDIAQNITIQMTLNVVLERLIYSSMGALLGFFDKGYMVGS